MAHTPGPWSRNIPPATKYTTVWAGRNTHVAHVDTRGLTPEEVEGNICLIAAAPELLAALKVCVAMLNHSMDGVESSAGEVFVPGVSDLELTPDGSVKLSQVEALIAKAEGLA